MRIPSGTTDQVIFFVAVDVTDLKTRETGLTSFTVYRARDTGAATAMTTPTVAELSAANMPGVYSLLLDEDMTIAAGNDSEEMVFHITQASMAPVTRSIELYRPKATVGNTLDVTATGAAGVDWGNIENPTTAQNLSATNIDVDQVVASVSGAVGSVTGAVGSVAAGGITASSIATGAIDADALAADAVAEIADGVWDEDIVAAHGTVDTAGRCMRTLDAISDRTNNANLNGLLGVADSAGADVASQVTDEVWDEDATGHQTQGTFGQAIGDPVADTNTIFKAVVTDATGATVGVDAAAILDDTGTAGVIVATNNDKTGYSIAVGGIGTTAFAAGAVDAAAIAADAITSSELAASAAQEIADEVLNRDIAGGGSGNTRNVRNALRALRNKVSESGGTLTVTQEDDIAVAWTAAVTRTASTDPITAVDPA